ncbi:MAG: hypothetical protein Q9170_001670 [Blastenia crenularia]
MFFDGTLQAGIARALQENKPVACFVRDESEQSRTWEQSYLNHYEIANLLGEEAVTLRLQSGSQEASFLTAYFPVTILPTMIIISNGQLIAHLKAGTDFPDFKNGLIKALSQSKDHDVDTHAVEPASCEEDGALSDRNFQPSNESSATTSSGGLNHQNIIAIEVPNASVSTPPRSVTPQSEATTGTSAASSLHQVMADRRRRLEADKAAKDAADKEKRKAVAQARHDAVDSDPGTSISKQSFYAQEQRKQRREAKEERQRILKAIENDKAERKEKEAQRRALAQVEAADATGSKQASSDNDQALPKTWATSPQTKQCSLQIRLFDGSTIRGKFGPQQTLNHAVRPWVEEQRTDGDTPYTFKQTLTPLRNKTISISEEEESLQSLGLLPSATMVMIPIQGYIGAYTNDQGLVGKAMSAGYNAASAGGSMLKGAFGSMLGFGRASPDAQGIGSGQKRDKTSLNGNGQTAATAAHEGVKIRTLNQRRDDSGEHELYNGNQVSNLSTSLGLKAAGG